MNVAMSRPTPKLVAVEPPADTDNDQTWRALAEDADRERAELRAKLEKLEARATEAEERAAVAERRNLARDNARAVVERYVRLVKAGKMDRVEAFERLRRELRAT